MGTPSPSPGANLIIYTWGPPDMFRLITGRNEVVATVIFLHLFVILFTGGCLPQCMLGYHPPQEQTPPPKQTNPRADTPGAETPLGADIPPRNRHPLGADTPKEQTPPEQTPPEADIPRCRPPWEADSGIRSMSGRYASYWNAFLFTMYPIHLSASGRLAVD